MAGFKVRKCASVNGLPDFERRKFKMMERFVSVVKPKTTSDALQVPDATKVDDTRRDAHDCTVKRELSATAECNTGARGLDFSDSTLCARRPFDHAGQSRSDHVPQLIGNLDKQAGSAGDNRNGGRIGPSGDCNKMRRRDKSVGIKRKPRSASTSDVGFGSGLERSRKRRRTNSESCGGSTNAAFIDQWLSGKPRTHGHVEGTLKPTKKKKKVKSERKRKLIQGARRFKLEVVDTVSTPSLKSDAEMFPCVYRPPKRRAVKTTNDKSVDFKADKITSMIVRAAVKWLGRVIGAIKVASKRSMPGPDDLIVSDDRALLHFDAMRRNQCAFEKRPAFRALENPRCLFSDHIYAALPLLFDDPSIIPRGRGDPIRCRLLSFMELYGQVRDRGRRKTTLLKIPAYDPCGSRVQDSRKRMRQNYVLRQVHAQWHRL